MTNWTTIEIMNVITSIGLVNPDNSVDEIITVTLPNEENMTKNEMKEWVEINNIRMKSICNFLIINDL